VLCVEFLVVTATESIEKWYFLDLHFIVVTRVVTVQWYCVVLEFIMVTAIVYIV